MLGEIEIRPLQKFPAFLEYLKGEKIPQWFLEEVYIFKIPGRHFEFLVKNYDLLQQDQYHRLGFSFEDFALAYMASQYALSIFSFDRDLLVDIKEFLEYDVISPESLPDIPQDSIVLLDTNILFALIDPAQAKFQKEFRTLMKSYESITFSIPELIMAEFKKTRKKLAPKKKEPDYSEFIDDDSNFAPKERRRKKEYKRHTGEKDWSISKRYRKIL